MADSTNSRVLEFNAPIDTSTGSLINGSANFVLGQGSAGNSFNTASCNANTASPTATTLCGPSDVAIDGSGNVYVGDSSNNRVVEFNTPLNSSSGEPGAGDATADQFFGQGNSFTQAFCNGDSDQDTISASTLCAPQGVGLDAIGNLYVADNLNNRVLEYNTPRNASSGETGAGDTTADNVIGATELYLQRSGEPPPRASTSRVS